ncbi:MAG: hypothetical protein QG568_628 [Patescibacteria group bacterium]|nr:hypothetical protein [Patescibacteria group bacterium]
MNITTDKISQATYISFSKEKVFKTRAFFNSKIIVDFGIKNRVLGIEILGPVFSFKRVLETKLDKWRVVKNFSRSNKVEPASAVSASEYTQNIQ